MSTPNPAPAPRDPAWARLVADFKPPPRRTGPLAALAVTFAAVAMLALYAAALAGTGVLGWLYVVNVPTPVDPKAGRPVLETALWALPLLGCAGLAAALLKPLLVPRPEDTDAVEVREFDQLRLFGLVQLLCERLGVPVPAVCLDAGSTVRIGPRVGLLSALRPTDAALTLGVPALASLSRADLAGLVARELSRLGPAKPGPWAALGVIELFRRFSAGPDVVDDTLARVSRSGQAVAVLGWIGMLLILPARLVLGLIYQLAALPVAGVLRAAALDADRHLIAMAGAKSVERALVAGAELEAARPKALDAARRALQRDRTVPGSFPGTLLHHLRELSDEERSRARAALDRDALAARRLAAAAELPTAGLLGGTEPALELLTDPDQAGASVTPAYLGRVLGPKADRARVVAVSLAPAATAAAKAEPMPAAPGGTLAEHLGYEPPASRLPLPAPAPAASGDLKAAITRLMDAKARCRPLLADADSRVRAFVVAEGLVRSWTCVMAQYGAGLSPDFKGYGLEFTTREDGRSRLEHAQSALRQATQRLDELNNAVAARVAAAAQLLSVPGVDSLLPAADTERARAAELLGLAHTVRTIMPHANACREMLGTARALSSRIRNDESRRRSEGELKPLGGLMRLKLEEARDLAGESLVGQAPIADLDATLDAARQFVDAWDAGAVRCVRGLAEIDRRIETALAQRFKAASGAAPGNQAAHA